MSIFNKLKLFLSLLAFLRRYPRTLIIGGSTKLVWLGTRSISDLPGFFSQCGQDSILYTQLFRVISQPSFPKVFVDIGCNHPIIHNNSYFFELKEGFRVLGIDALPTHKCSWTEQRPTALHVVTAVGDVEGEVQFEEVMEDNQQSDMYSSIKGSSAKAPALGRRTRVVPVIPISKILRTHEISEIGIMSIDIEGYEMQALLGIDFEAVQINVLIVENNSNKLLGDDRIRDFLSSKGFRFVARIWRMDDIFIHRSLDIGNAFRRN